MPTGYTYDIKDGISFEIFALNCARAFGACISLRDEPGGGEKIPQRFEPSDYHERRLAETRAEIARLESMSAEECERAASKGYDEAETHRLRVIQDKFYLRKRYDAMLSQVNAWQPPSADHKELQDFMRSQIEDSIKCDCDTSYYHDTPTKRLTGAEWKAHRMGVLKGNIDYHTAGHRAEVRRCNERNEWIRQLRESLKPSQR